MDVYLQTSHQSLAFRIVHFHAEGERTIFPAEGCGTEAYEVGPRCNKAGPCLVRLRGVTLAPPAFLAWFQASILERYVLRLYWLDPSQPPAASEEDLLGILTSLPPPREPVRIQCNPKRLERSLQAKLPLAWQLDPRGFTRVLSVVGCDGRFWWHLHPCEGFYRNPPQYGAAPDAASSARFKLAEALHVADVSVADVQIALDLGAAPGGWTMLLAERVGRVFAVDNADLSPAALALPNVTHIRSLAQHAAPHILRHSGGALADLLVCDMNMHITQAVRPVLELLPLLRPGALLVVTLKYFGIGRLPRKWEPVIEAELAAAGVGCCRFVWLLANTVSERTLIARKLPAGEQPMAAADALAGDLERTRLEGR